MNAMKALNRAKPWFAVGGIFATLVSSVMAAYSGWGISSLAVAGLGTAMAVWGIPR